MKTAKEIYEAWKKVNGYQFVCNGTDVLDYLADTIDKEQAQETSQPAETGPEYPKHFLGEFPMKPAMSIEAAKLKARAFGVRNGWTPGCASEQELIREFAELMEPESPPPKSSAMIAAEKAIVIGNCGIDFVLKENIIRHIHYPKPEQYLRFWMQDWFIPHLESFAAEAVREEREAAKASFEEPAERVNFEAWLTIHGTNFSSFARSFAGDYLNGWIEGRWQGWLAHAKERQKCLK